MTSDLAKCDLEDLRAEGLNPTDEDIIRLHRLAVDITNGKETTAANHPRWALAGGVVFHEPTLAARIWYEDNHIYAMTDDEDDWFFAFACANGRRTKYLDRLHIVDDIRREVRGWQASLTCTKSEVERAVYYAVVGNDYVVAEKTVLAKKREADEKARGIERNNLSVVESLLEQAAAATGFTYDNLLTQTSSRLSGMIYAAHIQAGIPMTEIGAKAHAVYMATLDAIRKRLQDEKKQRRKRRRKDG